jgi:membrane protein DedA with SNARE-associated domain
MISATSTTFITYSLGLVSYFKYPLLMVGAVIEGPILMIACGFLFHQGVFPLIPLFLALLIGDLIGDVIWYYVGYHFAEKILNKHGEFFGVKPEIFEKTKKLFHKYHTKILLISKLIMGLGLALAVLMVAGATRVSFKKYMLLNTVGEFFLVAWLLMVGYYLAEIYSKYIADVFKVGFILGTILILVLFLYFISRFIRRKALSKV